MGDIEENVERRSRSADFCTPRSGVSLAVGLGDGGVSPSLGTSLSVRRHKVDLDAVIPPLNGKLRLLSLNVFLRPPGIKNNASDYKHRRAADLPERLATSDVIALQEAFQFGSGRALSLTTRTQRLGVNHKVLSPPGGIWPHCAIDGGLALMSRGPIVMDASMLFHRGVHSDK